MEIFITIIIFMFLALFLAKALKRFIVLSLFITLTGILYIRINLTFLVSIMLAVIILKGCKDTLFNLKMTTMCIFKPRYKFKEWFLGKMVNVLFELNFTIFVCISYLTLINYVPYLFEIDNKFIAIAFITIYLIQFIKKVIFSKGYYSNIFLYLLFSRFPNEVIINSFSDIMLLTYSNSSTSVISDISLCRLPSLQFL